MILCLKKNTPIPRRVIRNYLTYSVVFGKGGLILVKEVETRGDLMPVLLKKYPELKLCLKDNTDPWSFTQLMTALISTVIPV